MKCSGREQLWFRLPDFTEREDIKEPEGDAHGLGQDSATAAHGQICPPATFYK